MMVVRAINRLWGENRSALALCGLFLLGWFLLSAYFILIGFHTAFLYCESGWFLNFAVAPQAAWRFWTGTLATRAYNGHFTPLAFGLELLQGYVLGRHAQWWLLRQTAALTLLGFCTAAAVRAGLGGAPRSRAVRLVAGSVAVIFLAQPAFLGFVDWPFMVMQMGCMSLGLLGLVRLLDYGAGASPRSAFWALLCAYGSLHVFGVGLVFSLATIGAVTLVLLLHRRCGRAPRRATLVWLLLFSVLTVAHALVMLLRSNDRPAPLPAPATFFVDFGAFMVDVPLRGLHGMWTPGVFDLPNPVAFPVDAAYGWSFVVAAVVALAASVWRAREPETIQSAGLLAFALGGLALYCFTLVLRLNTMPPDLTGLYIVGGRYIVFGGLFGILLVTWLCRHCRLHHRSLALLVPIVAIGAICANAAFFKIQVPRFWPHLTQNGAIVWQAVEQEVAEALREGRSLPDPAFKAGECDWHAKQFENLLRRDLDLPADRRLDWAD